MRILMIDDDRDLCEAVRAALAAGGILTDLCHDGGDAMFYIRQNIYDAIVLDRMLPGCDGLTLLQQARRAGVSTPVLMLTALGRIGDRVDGLDAGADDYLSKPFDMRELAARLRALLRRPAAQVDGPLRAGPLELDRSQLLLSGPSGQAELSKKECELLEVLMRSGGKLLARPVLLGRVWGADAEVEDSSLDSYIYFVRRRLTAVGAGRVVTVRGVGYRFEVDG